MDNRLRLSLPADLRTKLQALAAAEGTNETGLAIKILEAGLSTTVAGCSITEGELVAGLKLELARTHKQVERLQAQLLAMAAPPAVVPRLRRRRRWWWPFGA